MTFLADKVHRVERGAAAEAGLAGEHLVWDLRGDPAGDEEGEGFPGSVRQGGRQQESGRRLKDKT